MSEKAALILAAIDLMMKLLDKEIEKDPTNEEILEGRDERREKIDRFKENSG